MKQKKIISILVFCIAGIAAFASSMGIFSSQGPGSYQYESIRGDEITIYGEGLYQHMSQEVAIQGIAQDYITLFMGIPLLLISLFFARKGSLRGRFFLAGILGYFLVTYLFYLTMAMYNPLFLAYAFLMGASFFALTLTVLSMDVDRLPEYIQDRPSLKWAGGFLIFNGATIALLWLGIVVPPLLDGSIYPKGLEHYTTLIVQGMDLGLLLPLALVSGILLIRKRPFGYLLAPVYLVFLSLLMTALSAKIIAMGLAGYNIIPVIFIIPTINFISILCTILIMKDKMEIKPVHID